MKISFDAVARSTFGEYGIFAVDLWNIRVDTRKILLDNLRGAKKVRVTLEVVGDDQ